MNDIFKVFISMSLSGSLLILALLVLRHFLKSKISRQWQYYIWLIVIARLLLPFAPDTNLLGSIFRLPVRRSLRRILYSCPSRSRTACRIIKMHFLPIWIRKN